MTTALVILVAVALIVAGVLLMKKRPPPAAPEIPFGPLGSEALEFDALEQQFPLSVEHCQALTQENIEAFSQPQIDQIYARIPAGPIPDGAYHGRFFFAEGGNFRRMADVIGGLRGSLVDLELDKLNKLGELLWQGKRFYPEKQVLRNIIDKESLVATLFGVGLDEMRREEIFGKRVALLFPARLYTGDSLFDKRRPSVIIDYAGNDQIEGYIDKIDRAVGSEGLEIRDEIRMVRPGFYLGRAYFGTLFGLNFTLYNGDVAARDTAAWAAAGGTA
jgi:hypothetical protein